MIAALAAMATRRDRTAVFDSFAGPRLVIHGTEDGLIPVSEAARIERGPPDVRRAHADVGRVGGNRRGDHCLDQILSGMSDYYRCGNFI